LDILFRIVKIIPLILGEHQSLLISQEFGKEVSAVYCCTHHVEDVECLLQPSLGDGDLHGSEIKWLQNRVLVEGLRVLWLVRATAFEFEVLPSIIQVESRSLRLLCWRLLGRWLLPERRAA